MSVIGKKRARNDLDILVTTDKLSEGALSKSGWCRDHYDIPGTYTCDSAMYVLTAWTQGFSDLVITFFPTEQGAECLKAVKLEPKKCSSTTLGADAKIFSPEETPPSSLFNVSTVPGGRGGGSLRERDSQEFYVLKNNIRFGQWVGDPCRKSDSKRPSKMNC